MNFVLKFCEMHFALGFNSQRQFFVDRIVPREPHHRKKLKNFGKIRKF